MNGARQDAPTTLEAVLRILGLPISDDDLRYLIDALYRDAHAPAVSAALMLEKGVERDLYAVGLSREERTAVLGVLGRSARRVGRVARRADARARALADEPMKVACGARMAR